MVECEILKVIPQGEGVPHWRAWAPSRPPTALACEPEEPLVLEMLFGFRFRVWMLSFFIARGRGTWWGWSGAVGRLLPVRAHPWGLLHGHLLRSQPCRAGHSCGPVWGAATPGLGTFVQAWWGEARPTPASGSREARRALGVSSLCPRLNGCGEATVTLQPL